MVARGGWRPGYPEHKIKKRGSAPPVLVLTENHDILAAVASMQGQKPQLLVGFAAETEKVLEHAAEKRKRKGADWIIANDVSTRRGKSVMGGRTNTVHIVTKDGVEDLPEMPKEAVAAAIVEPDRRCTPEPLPAVRAWPWCGARSARLRHPGPLDGLVRPMRDDLPRAAPCGGTVWRLAIPPG